MKKIIYVGNFDLSKDNAAVNRVLNNLALVNEAGYQKIIVGFDLSDTIKENHPDIKFINFSRPKNVLQWVTYLKILQSKIRDLVSREDTVILYNAPSIVILSVLLVAKKSTIIGDITEWYESRINSFGSLARKIDIDLRMKILNKKMDGLILISHYLYEYYSNMTVKVIIPPLVKIDKTKVVLNSPSTNIKRRFIYAGTPGNKDELELFINSFQKANISNLALDVYGLTHEDYSSGCDSTENLNSDIKFHGYQSHLVVMSAIRNSDYAFILRNPTRRNNAGFPTKFAELRSLGIPILYNDFSDLNRFADENSVLVKNLNIGEVTEAIHKLVLSDILEHEFSDLFSVCNLKYQENFLSLINTKRSKHENNREN